MLVFMLKGLLRRGGACLALALVISVGACGMLLLSGLLQAQEEALNQTYEETEIRCVVSNLRGTKTDGLSIPVSYLDLCTKGGRYDFYRWVERVCAKRTVSCTLEGLGEELSLSGITFPEAAPALLAENGGVIRYQDGYTEEMFQSDEPLCIVPYALWLAMQAEDGDGELAFTLAGQSVALRIAGVYESDLAGAVYCPLAFLDSILQDSAVSAAESLSFYVKDTRTLDTFKREALKYFSEPLLTAEEKPMYFALTVQDGLFQQTVARIEDNLFLLRLLLPALYAISVGIGFLASFLFARGRTRDFAVMRSLGVTRLVVTGLVFMEQLVIGAFGCIVGMVAGTLLRDGASGTLWGGTLFALCYLAGALAAVVWITKVSVVALLQQMEE